MAIQWYDKWLEDGASKMREVEENMEQEYVVWGTIEAVTEGRVYAESLEEAEEKFIQGIRDGSIEVNIVDYDKSELKRDTIDGETTAW